MNAHELDFQNIFDEYQPRILRYMARMVSEDEAEDLTQEVFAKISHKLNTFRGEASLSTWLYRIATNTALDRLRSPSFQRVELVTVSENSTEGSDRTVLVKDEKPAIEKQLIREEMNDCIRGYIEKLPEDYRVVLILSEYEGLKNGEVAEILGVTLDTVKIRLHRARTKLKEELEANCEIHWVEEMPCSVMKSIKRFH